MKFFIDNTYNVFLLGIVLISGAGLLMPVLLRRGSKVTLLEATQMINQGKSVLVDVREQAEFATGHIRDAKHIPLKELSKRIAELDKFKSKSVIIVCQTGLRSSKAAAVLNQAGFKDVYSLSGGVSAWQAQGLPVIK